MTGKKTYFLKNMVCNCCKILLKEKLSARGIKIEEIKLGELTVSNSDENTEEIITSLAGELGFQLITGRDEILVEQIKKAVIELIHELNNIDSIVRKSDYLVEKLGMSYQHLSKTFSSLESITLERFIILHKIEKIKELIDSDEYTMSEISYMMDYSSIQHLSSQFKQLTGLTPSEYKKSDRSMRKSLDELY
jgi:AraC-like DNA-binding protein